MDDIPEREERVFVGGGIPDEAVESDGSAGKDAVEEGVEVEPGEETEEAEGAEEDAEEEDEVVKEDKDE
jgi:hypothetical protein